MKARVSGSCRALQGYKINRPSKRRGRNRAKAEIRRANKSRTTTFKRAPETQIDRFIADGWLG